MTGATGSVVAIIPARGGSKGIPHKNLAAVGGVSLVARAVLAALASDRIDRVVVSTDDRAIAAAALAAGAEIVDRPADIAGDTASSEAAVLHALGVIGGNPAIVVLIQATSPFIDPQALDAAISRVAQGESDVVFSATASHAFLWRRGDAGAIGINHDAAVRLRRQDSEPQYRETGAFYVMRADGFLAGSHRFFGRIGIAEVPELTALDIDSLDDLALARAIAPLVEQRGPIDADAIVMDFDGVHTDDRVHVAADGSEVVTTSRSDGMGIELLRRANVPLLILSKETHPVVRARASKLRIEVRQGVDEKAPVLAEWAAAKGVDLARTVYVGNDINDLGCFAIVGWPVAVADAHPLVLAAARVVLAHSGGRGAIRELADRVIAARAPGFPVTQPTMKEQ